MVYIMTYISTFSNENTLHFNRSHTTHPDPVGELCFISTLFVRVGDGRNRSSDTNWMIERTD